MKKKCSQKKTSPISINIEPGMIRKLSMEREAEVFNTAMAGVGMSGAFGMFATGMMLQGLLETARHILRTEWSLAHDSPEALAKWPDPPAAQLAELKATFATMYAQAKMTLGKQFQALWERHVAEANVCERNNLNNSKGKFYCYIVPKFNDDGTHDPVGEKDGPWAQSEKQ